MIHALVNSSCLHTYICIYVDMYNITLANITVLKKYNKHKYHKAAVFFGIKLPSLFNLTMTVTEDFNILE